MGCGCCSHASADDEPLRVTVFGLENSGKTSLVQVLKDSKKLPVTSAYVSTHGVIAVHVQTRVHLLVFDCGGCKHQRHIWPHLMNDADVVLFAVDSTDLVCLGEAKDALCDLLEDEALTDKPLLMVFTKADRREHPPLRQLEEALDLARIQADISHWNACISIRRRRFRIDLYTRFCFPPCRTTA